MPSPMLWVMPPDQLLNAVLRSPFQCPDALLSVSFKRPALKSTVSRPGRQLTAVP